MDITIISRGMYEKHSENPNFKRVCKNADKIANRDGINVQVYYDKLRREYFWIDCYDNHKFNKVPKCNVICEICFVD